MPGTFTIDFQDRTRASIAHEATSPRSGDAWTEMLYHVAFCVGRTLVNLELEDQVEQARQLDSWVGNGFADFPIHVGPPAGLTPCARFVSSFDGDLPSYTRGAYGFGLNARGLDYYGPMAAGVLLQHVHDAWDRPDDLLQPVRALCKRVAAGGVDEAGHVMLVTECVAESLKNFERRGVRTAPVHRPSADRTAMPARAVAGWKSWQAAFAGAALMLILGLALYFQSPPPAPAPTRPVAAKTPLQSEREGAPKTPLPHPPSTTVPVADEPKRAEVAPLHKAPQADEVPRPAPPPITLPVPRADVPVTPKAAPVSPAPAPLPMPAPPSVQSKPEQKPVQEARVVQPLPAPAHERAVTGRDGAPMVLVPAGEFLMGNEAEGDAPSHRVYLDALYIDRQEVTNARYLKFVEATRHRAPQHVVDPQYDLWVGATLAPGVADLPVVNVDWSDANAYCRWAGKRLPTEAEWEKAARGTDGRIFPWGNETPSFARLNFSRRWQGAHTLQPVGNYEAGNSPYGVQDMAGNVWEWVNDWYDAGSYAAGPARNPQGVSSGSSKILRGGSWTNSADTVRATHRREEDPDMRNSDSGFRCARGAN